MVSDEALKKLQEQIAAWSMTQRFVVQQLIEDYEREALLARIKKYAEDVCGAWAVGNALSKRNACCRGVCINVLRYVEQP